MGDCIFCKIVKGEIPCNKVYENDKVLAFYDINPQAPTHVLIIPKDHIPTFSDLKDISPLMAMMEAVREIARLTSVEERGFRLVINCKEEGGQVVMHLHMHLLGGKKLGERIA